MKKLQGSSRPPRRARSRSGDTVVGLPAAERPVVVRRALAAAWLLGIAPALASAQSSPANSPAELLQFRPSRSGVDYDTPTEKAAIEACKVEKVSDAHGNAIGYALRDGQGKLLRKFVKVRGGKSLDQWSYYQDGFEVYRENDLDGDLRVDECRWLNTAGTRHATVVKNKITGWKRLSAEEASKVLVQGLVGRDPSLIETVMAKPEELAALGIPKGEVERVAAEASQRIAQVNALLKDLVGWDKNTVWLRFDGTMPHVIPADAGADLKGDVMLYENAVVFVGQPNGQGNPANFAFLQAGELVRIGDTWKFVDLPRAVDPNKQAPLVAQEGGIRAALFREAEAGSPAAGDPQTVAALQALGKFDNEHSAQIASGNKRALAEFHVGRVPLLRNVVKLATRPDEQLVYNKQIVDSLAAAYQTDLYPEGLKLLDVLVGQGGKIASYAAYRKINAENILKSEQPGANSIQLQKELLTNLEGFLSHYAKSEEAPDALLQLASFNEFNGDEEQARKFYIQLAENFPASDAGKKGTGALRRLDLVGKPIVLKGAGLRGEAVDADTYRGKTLLITFWATWADPAKKDLPELLKLYQKYRSKGFEIVAVNLDNDKAQLEASLKETSLPWPQIFEPGGMDSRPANEYGIISLPTMFLVDPQGKVVNRSIRTSAELEKQLEKLGLDKTTGMAVRSGP